MHATTLMHVNGGQSNGTEPGLIETVLCSTYLSFGTRCTVRLLVAPLDSSSMIFFTYPQSTLMARYTKILATFFVSGVLHLSADIAIGITSRESGSIRFFCTQAVGILTEDSVQALCYHFVPHRVKNGSYKWRRVGKVIGYVWLVVFLAWSTPVWAYPAMQRSQGKAEDLILPFSVVESLGWVG